MRQALFSTPLWKWIFGDKPIINSSSVNDDGYTTMLYAKVISTNQNVISDEAIRRVESIVGSNGAYAIGAYVSIDTSKINPGETTLVFIDTDNDRAITIDVTVNQKGAHLRSFLN